jgi:hypothetical protein
MRVRDHGVAPTIGKLCRVGAGRGFRYVGGQRFVLKRVADAEQHFFVSADSGGVIRQLYWLQAEELLPGVPGGYDYTADSLRTVAALPWWVNLRAIGGAAQPGSDRSAALAHLAARGLRFPAMAPRLRMVYVPEPRGRREFMIVYLEAASEAGSEAHDPGDTRPCPSARWPAPYPQHPSGWHARPARAVTRPDPFVP